MVIYIAWLFIFTFVKSSKFKMLCIDIFDQLMHVKNIVFKTQFQSLRMITVFKGAKVCPGKSPPVRSPGQGD